MTVCQNYLCVCRAGAFASAVTALCIVRTQHTLPISHKSQTEQGRGTEPPSATTPWRKTTMQVRNSIRQWRSAVVRPASGSDPSTDIFVSRDVEGPSALSSISLGSTGRHNTS
jgi:hypothetical protein